MSEDEIQNMIFSIMKEKDVHPQDVIQTLGHSLLIVIMAYCQLNDNSKKICDASLEFMETLHNKLIDLIREIHPDYNFLTLEELREQISKEAEHLSENDADKKSRVNACMRIMEVDNLGFLLLSYMKNGSVAMSSNLRDKKMTADVLGMMREILFGDEAAKLFKIG